MQGVKMARAKKTDEADSSKKPTTRSKSNGGTSAATAPAPIKQTNQASAPQPILMMSEEEVRARAYELYLQRHPHGGTPEEDWYRAEAELRGKSA